MRAYLLVQVYPGKEEDFLKQAKPYQGVVSVDMVHGSFDMVMVLEGELKAIDDTVLKVRCLPSVSRTETLLSFERYPFTCSPS